MRFSKLITLCGYVIFASSSMQAMAVSTGSYFLGNHPDGNQNPPPYGLRLDGLLGHSVYTFDFDHASSDVRLDWDGSTIHIYGQSFGGADNGSTYLAGTTAVWDIDFTFDTGITTVVNGGVDDIVVGNDGHHANFGTLSSGLGAFDLRSHSDGSTVFNLGDETGGGHRGFAGISGWGWLDYSADSGATWQGSDDACCSDWLFTMTPVPVPAAVWLFGSGLIGLIAVARRHAA